MKELSIRLYQIVGVADDKDWSQVRTAMPLTREELVRGGGMVVVMRLYGAKEEMKGLADAWLEELSENFQKEVETNRADWVKKAVDEFMEKIGTGGMVVGVVMPGEERLVYIGGVGLGVVAGIARKGRKGRLWSPETEGVVSGALVSGDELVLGTEEFFSLWEKEEGETEEKVDLVRMAVVNEGRGSGTAGAVLEVKKWKEEAEEEIFADDEKDSEEKEETDTEEESDETEAAAVVINESGREALEPEEIGGEIQVVEGANEEEVEPLEKEEIQKSGLKLTPTGKKRWGGILLGLLAIGLILSVAFGFWQKRVSAEEEAYRGIAEPIEHALTEAAELKGLNPMRARSLVVEAKEKVAAQGVIFDEGRFADDWRELKAEVEKIWNEVSGEKKVEGKLWIDVGVISEGMEASELALVGEKLAVFDKKGGVVVGVELEDKSGQVAAGGIGGGIRMGGYGEKAVVLTDEGVAEVSLADKEKKEVIEKEGEWEVVDVDMFGGNVYILDREEIWKYSGSEGGLGARRRYLGIGIEPDLSGAVDMFIDGELWVLLGSGGVLRFDRGNKVGFEIKGLSHEWESVDRLVVSEKEMFVLDKKAGVVEVLDKETGEFLRELSWEGFRKAEDMEIDGENRRLFVATNEGVFEVGIE